MPPRPITAAALALPLLAASGCGSAAASPPPPSSRPATSAPADQGRQGPADPRTPDPASRPPAGEQQDPDLRAIVLLLDRPLHLDEAATKALVRKHFGDEAEFEEVMGDKGPLRGYIFMHPAGVIAVNVCRATYVPPAQLQAAADAIADPDHRAAFLRHRAWVSVDLLAMPGGTKIPVAQHLARAAADLMDERCVLLYSTDRGGYALPTYATAERLRTSDDPLQFFPLSIRAGEIPDLEKAIAEARRRLPEFLAAWERGGSQPNTLFMVKIAFPCDGGAGHEHMWVRVEEISGDTVRGELGNQPARIKDLRQGQRVTASLDDLSDWVYGIARDDCDGAFTDPRIRAAILRK